MAFLFFRIGDGLTEIAVSGEKLQKIIFVQQPKLDGFGDNVGGAMPECAFNRDRLQALL